MTAEGRDRGALAIVLHTHMPYVEGFGTWPFGEEWLWEAMAGCYLPLLELLDAGAPLTLSLTPVLCDQLAAPRGWRSASKDSSGRFVVIRMRRTRGACVPRARDARTRGRTLGEGLRAFARALHRARRDLVRAFAPHARWTSSATHAVLPLLATDAGLRAQVQSGVNAHRARFGAEDWQGGFWLPECAYAPWLGPGWPRRGCAHVCRADQPLWPGRA